MKQITFIAIGAIIAFLAATGTYTVPEHQQALKFQFGRVIGDPVTRPGLHFKIPFIQDVRYYDKRILQQDGDAAEIPTNDRKFIWVDTTSRWRISDCLKFYQAVRDIPNALLRMNGYINGATRDIISDHRLVESVRSSNNILKDLEDNRKESHDRQVDEPGELDNEETNVVLETIKVGRVQLSKLITEKVRKDLLPFGIELIDVQIRSIAYKEVVEQRVYDRMISEREKIATKIRSSGKGEKEKILGQLDLSLKKIESEAYRKSQTIKGKADAEALRILSSAMKSDPEYYEFMKTLETYKKTVAKNGDFILSTESDFLKILNKSRM